MRNFLKKYKDYFLVTGVTLLIFIILFLIKNIYPFGNKTILIGDLSGQIVPYYYYLYDCIKGGSSFLINFTSSNGVNFFGIITYYLFNPLSLLVLLVERSDIHLFMSIIIALKILICNITCLYMVKKLFKNINSLLSVCLALLYGFSAYGLVFYQITSWIDIMYLLPLIVLGLYNLLTEDNPKLYIITLILSLYFNFYLSLLVIIWIFLLSGLFIYIYKRKEIGKKILSLGISTILSIGSSLVILLPSYKQISISARLSSGFSSLLNSKLGPLTDKIVLFIFGPLLFVGLFLFIKDFKKNKKFLSFYIPSMILLLIPIIIEPVNKLLHFGSYAFFPYRFGIVTTLFIIIGAGYYFNGLKDNKKISISNCKKIVSLVTTLIISIGLMLITIFNLPSFHHHVNKLTLSGNKFLVLILIFMFILVMGTIFILYIINKGFNKYSLSFITILTVVHIACNVFIFVGLPNVQKTTLNYYDTFNKMYENKIDTYYRYKNEALIQNKNTGLITGMSTLDHFSSLTDRSNQETLKLLGYSSYWTHTHSNGGTLFSDILLGNKYILSNEKVIDNYTLLNKYNEYYFHEYNYDISYGYLIDKNINIDRNKNTFEIQNDIYKSITKDEDLFKVVDKVKYHNIEIKDNNYTIKEDNYIEYKVKVKDKSRVYLELLGTLNNGKNIKIFELFNIYLNDELYKENYPNELDNGLVDFGEFEDETIYIKIEFLEDCYLEKLDIGIMNMNKLNNFRDNYKIDYDLEFNKNNINIKIDSDEEKILFIPISNNDSYTLDNNGKKLDIINVYDNYIGIPLNKGINDIKITFIPSLLKISLVASIIFIISTFILLRFNIYNKILNNKFLQKIAKYIYTIIYSLVIIGVFILPIICFFISFVIYINI